MADTGELEQTDKGYRLKDDKNSFWLEIESFELFIRRRDDRLKIDGYIEGSALSDPIFTFSVALPLGMED